MDCFVEQALRVPLLGELTDDILSSSSMGVLKMRDVSRFFGPWLLDHQLSFDQACLIDDNARTCKAFSEHGGTAIHFSDPGQAIRLLREWIEHSEGTSRLPNASNRQ
jgi:FMN phosphatase YigB (HAD superfamily)